MILPTRTLSAFAAAAALITAAEAGTAFEADLGPNSKLVSLVGQYGNQLILKTDAAQPLLTSFSFTYESNYALSKGMILRFYANDGGTDLGAPGTLLYQSTPLDIRNGREAVTINYNSTPLPKTFTYTVEFLGNNGLANEAGLLTTDKSPVAGQSYDDIWLKNSGGWQLRHVLSGLSILTATAVVNDGPGLIISPATAGQVKVSWQDSTYKLQRSDVATPAVWADVAGVTGTSTTFTPTGARGFYRLITR